MMPSCALKRASAFLLPVTRFGGFSFLGLRMDSNQELKSVLEVANGKVGGLIHIGNVMELYKSHKVVKAAEIVAVIGVCAAGADLRIANPTNHEMEIPYFATPDMLARFIPQVGDYIVLYADGYVSFSPKSAFEDGYSIITEPDSIDGDGTAVTSSGRVYHNPDERYHLAEEAECVMLSLDAAGAPLNDENGTAYSLWGRVCAFAGRPTSQSTKPGYIERMHQEQQELADRISKLEVFASSAAFMKLPQQEQGRMVRQLVAMREYLIALSERLNAVEST
ncbi:MAG: crAss001_48 related protein [Plesiomonas shigelloides]